MGGILWVVLVGMGTLGVASVPVGHVGAGLLFDGVNAHRLFGETQTIESVSPADYQFATEALVHTLLDVGAWVKKKWGDRLQVGDISKQGGGKLARHYSHRNGLDVDVAYLPVQLRRRGHRWKHFHNRFTEDYVRQGKVSLNFNARKNEMLLKYILRNHPVSRIYVSCPIKRALGERLIWSGESGRWLDKVYALGGHDDHFHLRIQCPPNAPDCQPKGFPFKQKHCDYRATMATKS